MAKKSDYKSGYLGGSSVKIIFLILGGSMFFEGKINSYFGLKGITDGEYSGLSPSQVLGGTTAIGERLNVHFVDVGQGDACIIELPDDKKMIIDGGKDKEKKKLLDYIDENIVTDDGKKIEKFDYAVLTHSDEDHCGGLDDVLQTYQAEIFYRPNQIATYNNYNDPYKNFLSSNYGKNTLSYMRAIDAGHKNSSRVIITDAKDSAQNNITPRDIPKDSEEYYEINFYTPTKDNYKDVNNYSPIIILEYQNRRIVLSGDAEAEAEAEFVSLASAVGGRYGKFDSGYTVDLIKLGHHGSKTSSSADYLETLTTPSSVRNVIIIISCGADNSYNHPHTSTIDRLIELGFKESNILRTDVNGNIAMSICKDETNTYQLFYGAELVRTTHASPIAWREIALIILAIAIFLLIIYPLLPSASKGKIKRNLAKA